LPSYSSSPEEKTMTTIAATSAAPPGRLAGWITRNGPVLAIFAIVFALWEAAVRALDIPDYILPSPSVIMVKIVVSWQLLLVNALVTLQEILLGFGPSVAIAIRSRSQWSIRASSSASRFPS
jgi:hypothetical protein